MWFPQGSLPLDMSTYRGLAPPGKRDFSMTSLFNTVLEALPRNQGETEDMAHGQEVAQSGDVTAHE